MIGERLTRLRKQKKMTQQELGDYLSLTKYSISLYEKNKNKPTEETLIELAKLFDVSIDHLVGLIDEPYSYERDSDFVLKLSRNVPEIVVENLSEFVKSVNKKYEYGGIESRNHSI